MHQFVSIFFKTAVFLFLIATLSSCSSSRGVSSGQGMRGTTTESGTTTRGGTSAGSTNRGTENGRRGAETGRRGSAESVTTPRTRSIDEARTPTSRAIAEAEIANPGTVLETGIASWYGPAFHGKRTANGEIYDKFELTAAHRTLPFNTMVKVTNTTNGKSVIVRINDRGPYVGPRVIDISRAAAERIDMIGPGTAEVTIELVSSESPVSRRVQQESFTVQLASYTRKSQADDFASRLNTAFVHEASIDGTTYFRVYSGQFRSRDDAQRHMNDLGRRGFNGFVKQLQN